MTGKSVSKLISLFVLCCALMSLICASAGAEGVYFAKNDRVKPVPSDRAVRVSDVDELLSAIAPDTDIVLERGEYDLSTASGYGEASSPCYRWEECYDGFELVISCADGLRLLSEDDDDTVITTEPRYANVIRFESCDGLTLSKISFGHTEQPGICGGGVVRLEKVKNAVINDCSLFGCGTVGVDAADCENVYVCDSDIFDCSYCAVASSHCFDVRVTDCDIHDCDEAYTLFDVTGTTGFAVVNCEIENNVTQTFMNTSYSPETYVLGCELEDNAFNSSAFCIIGKAPVLDNSDFHRNNFFAWYDSSNSPTPGVRCTDMSGHELSNEELEGMRQKDSDYDGPMLTRPEVELSFIDGENGRRSVFVTSADEFLAAIGPKTDIILGTDTFDLSTAFSYGNGDGKYYRWDDCYDGAQLVITDCSGLSITSDINSVITAVPRYANVLSFRGCDDLSLNGFTAGHTEMPGECTGGVLSFENCGNVCVNDCVLYGCGTLGVEAYGVNGLEVAGTEIYDCSFGAAELNNSQNVVFRDCNVHDCHLPEFLIYECEGIEFINAAGDKWVPDNGSYVIDSDGKPVEWNWESEMDVVDSLDPSSIQFFSEGQCVRLVSLPDGESAQIEAAVTLAGNNAVMKDRIFWALPDGKLEADCYNGSTVNLTSHLRPGEAVEVTAYYISDGLIECSETLVLIG